VKSLLYTLFLFVVLAGSVALLRHSGPASERVRHNTEPIVKSHSPAARDLDSMQLESVPADELVAIGDELMQLWHPREAADVFEQALRVDTTRVDVLLRMIECNAHDLLGNEDAARATWARASAVAVPEDTLLLYGVRDLFIDRDYASAIERFNSVTQGSPATASERYFVALAHFYSGHINQARGVVEDLLSEDESQGRVMELFVRILAAEGDTKSASTRAHELARMYPEEPQPYVLLAQVELAAGHTESAIQFCNNALSIDARYIPAILTRANLYASAGDLEAARVSFEKLLLFEDSHLRSIGYHGVAFVEFLDGHFDEGIEAIDEAIRNAMLAGSVRRGLSYATWLVDALCELGQPDSASEVVDRWIKGFGTVPETLGRLRIDLLEGRTDVVTHILEQLDSRRDWLVWARSMSLDTVELAALACIAEGQHARALVVLADSSGVGVGPGVRSRRAFLHGYAAFKGGNAETGRVSFASVRSQFYGTEFPYRGDPVLMVQSWFYGAECALAAGDVEAAREGYQSFIDAWGDTSWELRAITRSRDKLSGSASPTPR